MSTPAQNRSPWQTHHSWFSWLWWIPVAVALVLVGCTESGGSSKKSSSSGQPPEPVLNVPYACPANTVSAIDGAAAYCATVFAVDTTGDNTIDGLDLDGDLVPELVFVAPDVTDRGHRFVSLDANGDGVADYFAAMKDDRVYLSTEFGANGQRVAVVYAGATPQGFALGNSLATADATLAALETDITVPSLFITTPAGMYGRGPDVALQCWDNLACNAIAYTTDGSMPDFNGNGTVANGPETTASLATATGAVTLKAIARDSAGNVSGVRTAVYDIQPAACTVTMTPIAPDRIVNAGSTVTLNASGSGTTGGTLAGATWHQMVIGDAPDVTAGAGFLTGLSANFTAPAKVTTVLFNLALHGSDGCLSATARVRVVVVRNASKVYFVNAAAGSDSAAGSLQAPFKSLARALKGPSYRDVYLTHNGGHAMHEDQLVVPAGVNLYGGFNHRWVRDAAKSPTRIQREAPGLTFTQVNSTGNTVSGIALWITGGAEPLAIEANLQGGTLAVEQSRVEVTLPTGVGGAVYGIHTAGTGTLGLLESFVYVTNGASGLNGQDGVGGIRGAGGRGGDEGSCRGERGSGGSGGTNSAAPAASGGRGGRGGAEYTAGETGHASPGGAAGGVGGGQGGDAGDPGAAGVNGAHGTASIATPAFSNGRWVSQAAQAGGNGGNGMNGTGGGGGGGGEGGGSFFSFIFFFLVSEAGGGGGGGGAGGAGGAGGTGGTGGGAAIAVSAGHVGATFITDSTVIAGEAGDGGTGGRGAPGGTGGIGGARGLGCSHTGGKGGDGGKGGTGGNGAGGAGGSSFALVVTGSAAVTVEDSEVRSGPAGKGGASTGGYGGAGGLSYLFFHDGTGGAPTLTLQGSNTLAPGAGGAGGTGGTSGNNGVSAQGNF